MSVFPSAFVPNAEGSSTGDKQAEGVTDTCGTKRVWGGADAEALRREANKESQRRVRQKELDKSGFCVFEIDFKKTNMKVCVCVCVCAVCVLT
jgi:hypothetical protein